MPGQGFEIGPFAIHEVQHQEPAEDQLVSMPEAGPQHSQGLRDATGTGQGQGPGLLSDRQSDRHSRSRILGSV
jgi:hypothetical protein